MTDYQSEFARSLASPVDFWREQAQHIAWYQNPQTILDQDANRNPAWFSDGTLNSCYLALDYQIEQGRGARVALIYDSPVTGIKAQYTYAHLRDEVARFAGVLLDLGVVPGDRVVIYMPMIPEAAIAMLACARIGAVHSVVFGGFAASELATRIDDARPRVILSASCGIEFSTVIDYKPLLDEAIKLASHAIEASVVFQRELNADIFPDAASHRASLTSPWDLDWQTLTAGAQLAPCIPVAAGHPLYILYTSGTTGKPKGIVRDNGGHAVALAYSMRSIFDAGAGDVFWAASDVGWVVGHSYIVYGPLFAGCTSVLFEGKPVRTPDAGTFWRVAAEHRVNVFFAAPTGFRAIRKEDPDATLLQQYDLSALRTLFVAGERTDPATWQWLSDNLGIPVIDHWWQTETGWPVSAAPMGIEVHPPKPGSVCLPVPGFDVRILSFEQTDEHTSANDAAKVELKVAGKTTEAGGRDQLRPGEEGDVVIKLPLPPGCLTTIWGDHKRYVSSYLSEHPGYFHTGDGGYIDVDGYLYIMGRTDDVINVAGHRLSTGRMEEVVSGHPAVAECAVIGIEDPVKGQVPTGLVIVKDGINIGHAELEAELVALVRQEVGAFANFHRAVMVPRLPRTRSGKILRQVIRKIVDKKPWVMPATIDDPAILDELRQLLIDHHIGLISQ